MALADSAALLLACLLLVCTQLGVEGRDHVPLEWGWEEYPHPQADTEMCGRKDQPSLICDPNMILTYEQATSIDKLLTSVRTDTRCPCTPFYCSQNRKGYRMAVALVNKMRPYNQHKGENVAQSLDESLHLARLFTAALENSKWKSGQCDEDVVLFYSLKDNVVYSMTGEKAREKLTDDIASEILLDNRRYLSPGKDIYKGLHNIIQEFKNVFSGTYRQTPTPPPPQPTYKAVIGHSRAHISIPNHALYFITLYLLYAWR